MKNDVSLYERKYKKENQIKNDITDEWKELIGEAGVQYIKQKWNYALNDKAEYIAITSDLEYERLKKYYMNNSIIANSYVVQQYKEKNLGFFFYEFLTLIYQKIKEIANCGEIKLDEEAYIDYLDTIYNKFMLIAARTIILEMRLWHKEHLYIKLPNEAYYIYSEQFLLNKKYRIQFFEKYPAVLRGILEILIFAIDNFKEFYERIEKDKYKIIEKLCEKYPFEKILHMENNLSDSHCKGKSVMRLEFDNGWSVIYKPHSIKNEILYQRNLAWFGENCGIEMYIYKCLEYGEYGWTEYVPHKACKNKNEVMRYYNRIGIHIFLCYLLNTSDIHAENLIAFGEYPVIVDLETIVTPVIYQKLEELNERINIAIHQSVLYSGILPLYILSKDNQKGVDISALNGTIDQIFPIKIPTIINPFRIDMEIRYSQVTKTKMNNVVRYNGEIMLPSMFADSILVMFKKAYQFMLTNRLEIRRRLKEFVNIRIRFVPRNSQQYSMVLSSSYHPQLTRDMMKRHMFLYVLYNMKNQCNKTAILESEIKDLLQGDLPYFYCFGNDTDLYDSRNEKISSFFKQSMAQQLLERIEFMNVEDLECQSRYIEISLGMSGLSELKQKSKMIEENLSVIPMKKKLYIQRVIEYGDFLLNTAIYNEDRSDVNWIGIKLQESCETDWKLIPLGDYLYDGKGGITIFLHLLKSTGVKKYDKICETLDKIHFKHTDKAIHQQKNNRISVGAYYGEASILYIYELCYKLYKTDIYADYCERQVKVIEKYFDIDTKFDFLFGNAGAIVIVLNLFELTKKQRYLELAIKMGEYLLQHRISIMSGIGWKSSINPYCLTGLSHGNSGYALAFALLYDKTKNKKYINIIQDILAYENNLYSDSDENWKDIRSEDSAKSYRTVAWCHGAAGILLERTRLFELLKNTELEDTILNDIEKAIKKVMKLQIIEENCLCHGNLGNILILQEFGKRMQNKDAINLAEKMFETLNRYIMLEGYKFLPIHERYNPGFMTGATGVFYAIMKYHTHSFPNILLLEI